MSSECRTKAHINRNENRYGCIDNLRGHHDHSQKQHIRCFSVPRPPQIEEVESINQLPRRLPQIEVSENISGLAINLAIN
ncbi:hypothetical protein DTY81_13095 [Escherichia coli]|nr:hypothetical protein [Escherichia coli]EGD5143091.1 hypothetical protein [Escherichia coli]